MTTVVKPKERQFQVVPVPAVFTRGRWECVDYKDNNTGATSTGGPLPSGGAANFTIGGGPDQQQTIEFDKSSSSTGTAAATPLATQMLIATPNGNPVAGVGQHHQQMTNIEMSQTSSAAQPQQSTTIPTTSSVPHFDISTGSSQSVPATTEIMAPSVTSADNINMPNGNATSVTTMTSTVGPNAVAIDNKIEQAMDLVKTHLTFAVREEVEILRSTIMELESRVNILEHENQILRQFAPADVVSNLAALVQAAVQHQQKAVTAVQQAQQQKMQTVPSAPVIMDHPHQQHVQQQQLPPQQQHPQIVGHSPTPTSNDDV